MGACSRPRRGVGWALLLSPVILAFAVAIASPADGRAATVTGKIVYERTRAGGSYTYPASYVRVALVDNRGRSIAAYSNRFGVYYFHKIPPGRYRVEVRRPQQRITRNVIVGREGLERVETIVLR